jgi:hypothetical protein
MLNAEYRRINLDHNLEPALALDLLYEGYAEVDLAASLAAELAPTSTESVIAKERIASVPEASGLSLSFRNHDSPFDIRIGPTERPGGFGVSADVFHEFARQVGDRGKYATRDYVAFDFGEPDLYLVQPG